MKLIRLYLLALCLCLPNLLLAQEINLLLEEQLEELADDDETVNYDDLLQELSQPIDLNNATKEQCDEQITIVCNEGRKGCKGNTPRTCHNNAWVRLADCRDYQLHCKSDAKLKTGSCI